MKTTKDYPAGHSMDSEWFAVDKDGNLGIFDTNQDGYLPQKFPCESFIIDHIRDDIEKSPSGISHLTIHKENIICLRILSTMSI